jgi:hypothetical protein
MTSQKKDKKILFKRIEFGLKNLELECERRNIKYKDIKSEYANKSTLTNHNKLHVAQDELISTQRKLINFQEHLIDYLKTSLGFKSVGVLPS